MFIARRILILTVGLTALAFAPIILIAPPAVAQTMGEYGLTVNHSASSAAALSRLAPGSGLTTQVQSAGNNGSTQTDEIRTYDTGPAGQDTGANGVANGKNQAGDDSAGDWVQVK